MEYSAESIRFLHVAYALMFLGQLLYVAFLLRRWSQAKADVAIIQARDTNRHG